MAWTGARSLNSGTAGSAGSSANPFALVYTTPAIYDVFLRTLLVKYVTQKAMTEMDISNQFYRN